MCVSGKLKCEIGRDVIEFAILVKSIIWKKKMSPSNDTNINTVHLQSKDKQSPSILSGRQFSKVACTNMTNEEEKGEVKKYDLPQDNDVSRVIAKSKRAAASLWMILHAQVNSIQHN